jgi:hypothetical protein
MSQNTGAPAGSPGNSASSTKPVVPPEKAVPIAIPKFTAPPVIDGRLDDESWKAAAVFKDFIQVRPGDNIAPSLPTIAYVGYDAENLYFGFHCFDEPDKVRATVAKRDDVFGDDNIRVALDTFNDQRRAYVLFFTPLGIQADGIRTEEQSQGPLDLSVDIVMESRGVITTDGWTAEAKVPFKSLRYAAGKGKSWGFNITRTISRFNDENDSWMPQERGVSGLRQLGQITGFDGIKQERTLEIVPSLTLSQTSQRIEDTTVPFGSRMLNGPAKADLGVSVKYQITPNVTLDAALNPDFAEVEADAPVVSANERFPIFFPEKRPFFLEGIDYFRSPLQVVNTRNIADPDIALKLTGKTGKNTFGILTAVDRFPNTDVKAYVGVLRLRRDMGKYSTVGLLGTTYHRGSRRHNNLFGFDGKIASNPKGALNFQVVGSATRGSFFNLNTNSFEYRTGNGAAYDVNYDYTGRNRGFRIGVNGRSKYYRADVGFTRRTNTHGLNGGFRLGTSPKPNNTLINVITRNFFGFSLDERGRPQNARYTFLTELNFQQQLQVRFEAGTSFENIYEDEFRPFLSESRPSAFFGRSERAARQYFGEASFSKTFNKRIRLEAEAGFTTNDLDLDFGAGERYPRVSPAFLADEEEKRFDPGKGFNFGYEIVLDLTPVDPWTVSLSYEREKLKRNDTKLTAFDSNIFSLRSTYQFTRFTFARARWDYQMLDGGINGQLLFGWTPNPGTAFYVGYNDNLFYQGFNDFTGDFDSGFRRDGRRFFIRFSYLFRRSL